MMLTAQKLRDALDENRKGGPWKNFLRHNKVLGPRVEAYCYQDGPRLSDFDMQIGVNHYATMLVWTEDVRRALTAPVPDRPEALADFAAVVQVTGDVEPDGRIPTAAIRR